MLSLSRSLSVITMSMLARVPVLKFAVLENLDESQTRIFLLVDSLIIYWLISTSSIREVVNSPSLLMPEIPMIVISEARIFRLFMAKIPVRAFFG